MPERHLWDWICQWCFSLSMLPLVVITTAIVEGRENILDTKLCTVLHRKNSGIQNGINRLLSQTGWIVYWVCNLGYGFVYSASGHLVKRLFVVLIDLYRSSGIRHESKLPTMNKRVSIDRYASTIATSRLIVIVHTYQRLLPTMNDFKRDLHSRITLWFHIKNSEILINRIVN